MTTNHKSEKACPGTVGTFCGPACQQTAPQSCRADFRDKSGKCPNVQDQRRRLRHRLSSLKAESVKGKHFTPESRALGRGPAGGKPPPSLERRSIHQEQRLGSPVSIRETEALRAPWPPGPRCDPGPAPAPASGAPVSPRRSRAWGSQLQPSQLVLLCALCNCP